MRRRLVGAVGSALLAVGVTLVGAGPAKADPACGTLLPLAVPACGALWGISTPGGSSAAERNDEATVGRKFDVTYHFHYIGDPLPNADEASELASGHLLRVNIESIPYSYGSIAAGAQDAGLTRQAKSVAAINAPVYVSFEHEPDVRTKVSRGTPAQYVAAFRHVHDLFVANGATNAVWVWITTGWYLNFPNYAGFYPGNDVVDWIAWEAYSTVGCNTTRNILSTTFADAAGPMYTWLHDGHGAAAGIDITKPEMISEYGAVYDNGNPGAQGAWYQGIPQALKTQFPDIKAVAKWDNVGGACRYAMSVSPLTIAGVTAAGHDPYVNQTPVTPQPPTAAFTASCTALTCNFDASASAGHGSPITSYSWDFGDTNVGTDATTSHTYAAGTYPVTLTVTDATGATGTATRSVSPGVTPPIAFVAAASTNGNAPTESVKVPATVTAGNGMVLIASGSAQRVPPPPPGWTQVDTITSSVLTSTVWQRVAGAADANSTVTVNFGAIYKGTVHLLAYSGTNASNPVIAAVKRLTYATASSYTTPTTTAPADGEVTLSYWAGKSSSVTSWTTPAGQMVRSTANGFGSGRINSVATDAGPAPAGPVGGLTASTDTTTSAYVAWTIVLG